VVAMSERPTLLRMLVGQRHWQKYEIFRRQYENAANDLATKANDPGLRGLSIAKRQFERWLAGNLKTKPYPDHCRVLEHLFDRSIDELLAPVTQEPEHQALLTRRHGLPVMGAPPPAPTTVAGSPPSWNATGEHSDLGHALGTLRRRKSLEVSGEEITRELSMTAHESSEHAGFVAARRLEPVTLEQLHDDVIQIARHYAHTPPLLVYGDAKRLRDRGFELLEWTRRTEQEDDLYLLIGQACGLLASVSFDLGNRDAATEQARSAWIYGRHIGHHGLCAWARGMQALIAYWSGARSNRSALCARRRNTHRRELRWCGSAASRRERGRISGISPRRPAPSARPKTHASALPDLMISMTGLAASLASTTPGRLAATAAPTLSWERPSPLLERRVAQSSCSRP
jgi:hypothetical protein